MAANPSARARRVEEQDAAIDAHAVRHALPAWREELVARVLQPVIVSIALVDGHREELLGHEGVELAPELREAAEDDRVRIEHHDAVHGRKQLASEHLQKEVAVASLVAEWVETAEELGGERRECALDKNIQLVAVQHETRRHRVRLPYLTEAIVPASVHEHVQMKRRSPTSCERSAKEDGHPLGGEFVSMHNQKRVRDVIAGRNRDDEQQRQR